MNKEVVLNLYMYYMFIGVSTFRLYYLVYLVVFWEAVVRVYSGLKGYPLED